MCSGGLLVYEVDESRRRAQSDGEEPHGKQHVQYNGDIEHFFPCSSVTGPYHPNIPQTIRVVFRTAEKKGSVRVHGNRCHLSQV